MTPLMKQYWDIKSFHKDKILLFRMGDFYEMFFDDAVTAAPIVGITLTQRNKKSSDETPMCGVPHHSIAGPINKLLARGLKVAICDQIEDPKTAKGIVKRAVTRVLTPGMVYDSDTLDQNKAHYIASIDKESVSFVDTTTGEAFFYLTRLPQIAASLLNTLPVAEIVISASDESLIQNFEKNVISVHESLEVKSKHLISGDPLNAAPPTSTTTTATMSSSQKTTLVPNSAKRIISYIEQLSSDDSLKAFRPFEHRSLDHKMNLQQSTVRHLEIFTTNLGETNGSFFNAINRTKTSAGSRLLQNWILFPLLEKQEILKRQASIGFWRNHLLELKKTREILSHMGDIERRLNKITQSQSNARDLQALAQAIRHGISALKVKTNPNENWELFENLTGMLDSLCSEVDKTIIDEPPLTVKQGYLIRPDFSKELQELVELTTHSQSLLSAMELREKQQTGITSLKIRYNNVFGYYIEITNTHKDKVPSHYQRKQTLANAERYCTDELVELEKKILTAQTRRSELEYEIFESLKNKIVSLSSETLKLASLASKLDVITALAWLSIEENYTCPEIVDTQEISLKSSRHPVVEQSVKSHFVPNDITLLNGNIMLLTGPNMAGKSTLMRQVALTSILAQMGSFVPASTASIPIFDAIYTRIGASDQLSEGLSTFMVEMTETSYMLKNATPKSLLILDEIGRGTSTFDGMCLAQSILEFILKDIKSITFFATHYHELTQLDQTFSQIQNAHMSVTEKNGTISFLHTLAAGPARKSYGVQVAEIAGLPKAITDRAKLLLNSIDSSKSSKNLHLGLKQLNSGQMSLMEMQADLFETNLNLNKVEVRTEIPEKIQKFIDDFKAFSINQKTPLQAISQIAEWQSKLSD